MVYNAFSRFLHRLALNSDARCEAMFDIERNMQRGNVQHSDQHVFVCGLARAGTTILMRSLYDTGEFSSLTYRDMPFLMMPNLWRRLSSRDQTQMEKTERAHGDGIRVDYDSPEALEEVFWRVFAGEQYIREDTLQQHGVDQDVLEKFKTYVALVNLRYGNPRYLSKNNNNILRIDGLLRAFPESHVLIPFRSPLAQANSLRRQHQLFLERHETDPFSKQYMNWLVHHEFGAEQRHFSLKGAPPMPQNGDRNELPYWLRLWMSVYSSLLDQYANHDQVYFVCYEDLCSPAIGRAVREALSNVLGVPTGSTEFKAAATPNDDTEAAEDCHNVYDDLRSKAAEKLAYVAG